VCILWNSEKIFEYVWRIVFLHNLACKTFTTPMQNEMKNVLLGQRRKIMEILHHVPHARKIVRLFYFDCS